MCGVQRLTHKCRKNVEMRIRVRFSDKTRHDRTTMTTTTGKKKDASNLCEVDSIGIHRLKYRPSERIK